MKFLKGTATGNDGKRVDVLVSSQRTLLKYADGSFAVRDGGFRGTGGPYLAFGARVRLAVRIDGHAYDGHDDAIAADYLPFRKSAVSLPNTCIESAEHVLKCLHANAHSVDLIPGDTGAHIWASLGDRSADIDVDDLNEVAYGAFKGKLRSVVDAANEGFDPGEGMALVDSRNPTHKQGGWTVHAVAVLLKSSSIWDRFIVVSEAFADGSGLKMTTGWKVAAYESAQDFKDAYFNCMPPSKYTLWKLSATPR